jgi:hypothetical protein
MNLELRPANLGEILDRTASLYRSRFLVFVGIGAIPAGTVLFFAAGVFLLSAWAGVAEQGVVALLELAIGLMFLLAIPVCLALTALGSGAMSHAASKIFLGERIAIRGSYRAAWSRGWRYIGLLSLQVLFLAVVPFAAWILAFAILAGLAAASRRSGSALFYDFWSVPSAVLLIVGAGLAFYFFWMLLRICLAFSACVVEECGAWASLKRATLLSKGTRGRILVLYILCAVLSGVVSLVISVPILIVLSLIPQLNTPQHQQTMGAMFLFLMYGAVFISQAFTKPVSGIALILFYYDQRIRKEAFDIEWMMREAGMVAEELKPAEAEPWLPEAGSPLPRETEPPPVGGTQPGATGESS